MNQYVDNFLYESALRIVETNIGIYRSEREANLPKMDWPIKSVSWRIKPEESFLKKCHKKGVNPTDAEAVAANIKDIAGFRIVVPFLHNIGEVVDYLKKYSGFATQEKDKNYVAEPKSSGYRGVHLILGVPVATSSGLKVVTVEFQVRTTAMDEWCSKEHAMNYKNDKSDPEMEAFFRKRADETWEADLKYEEYYQELKKLREEKCE